MCAGAEKQEMTAQEMQTLQMAQGQIKDWRQNYRPLENQAILDTKKQIFSERGRQTARGQAHIAATGGLMKQLPQVDPNAAAGKLQLAGVGVALDTGLSRAAVGAEAAGRASGYSGLVDLAKFGRGQQAIALDGQMKSTQMAIGTHAAETAIKQSAKDFNAEAIGAVAGMAAGMAAGGVGGGSAADTFTMNDTQFTKGKGGVFFNERTGMAMDYS